MLRITVEMSNRVFTLRLEGSLMGPWLQELEDCWQGSLDCQHAQTRLVDLTEVTFVDAAGKACLAAMHRQGAEFIAADCMTKAIVFEITGAEITGKPICGCVHSAAPVAVNKPP